MRIRIRGLNQLKFVDGSGSETLILGGEAKLKIVLWSDFVVDNTVLLLLGEEISAEELGGAQLHCSQSGYEI